MKLFEVSMVRDGLVGVLGVGVVGLVAGLLFGEVVAADRDSLSVGASVDWLAWLVDLVVDFGSAFWGGFVGWSGRLDFVFGWWGGCLGLLSVEGGVVDCGAGDGVGSAGDDCGDEEDEDDEVAVAGGLAFDIWRAGGPKQVVKSCCLVLLFCCLGGSRTLVLSLTIQIGGLYCIAAAAVVSAGGGVVGLMLSL